MTIRLETYTEFSCFTVLYLLCYKQSLEKVIYSKMYLTLFLCFDVFTSI